MVDSHFAGYIVFEAANSHGLFFTGRFCFFGVNRYITQSMSGCGGNPVEASHETHLLAA